MGADEWTFEGQPTAIGAADVTLVEGNSFCVCARSGDIHPGGAQGVYYADTRLLSRWELRVDDEPVEPLQVLPAEPYHATFVGRARPRPGRAESTLLVTRERYVGAGMREDVTLTNMAGEPAACVVTLLAGSDVADLFEVKSDRVRHVGDVEGGAERGALRFYSPGRARGARVTAEDAQAVPGLLTFPVVVPARGRWRATVQVHPIMNGREVPPTFPAQHPPEQAEPARRLAQWERESPRVDTRHQGLARALRRSREDLGALRLFDEEEPATIAAGAPWFMTLFGRDSLLTSWMALPLDQSLALGTLRRLAGLQGRRDDPMTEEEPGKIMHELRFGMTVTQDSAAAEPRAYYGSVDSTPLFVMLLGELRRWGLHTDEVDALLPHADAALGWIERSADGQGFVSYRRRTDRGLINQGWKDSFDGINFADGTLARAPIALAEMQGYVYAAYIARMHFAHEQGDATAEEHYAARAAALKRAFNERFWLPDRGYYAVGLDWAGRPIDALASNMGHCLWTGIADEDKAASVAEHLLSPQMFSGYGVRTLASGMGAYNPMSYHNGSVWPHDNAIIVAGLIRYGFAEEAQRVTLGLLDAAEAFGGRLPELFCGFDRSEFGTPVPYPTSCSPQAWAAAAPILLLRSLLRFDPWVPYGKVWLAPAVPEELGDVLITGLPMAGARIDVEARQGRPPRAPGLPEGIELITTPRRPLTATGPCD
ncbi:glycogen debranching N-terminal domain-containing protein [Bailinhaonella thermotolerans]|uniref:Amylo-alpha-1,6-glucosidase n=1 Tax=Bailinhaonella thermotolerans TaxID=1070861 RepID=A0A3A4A937_9ACTN|nr:glycogen debranching N-terminal domain-containing protein [Bailinhaonella thermotolerans]RJL25115.1 amylo-alpha-1,6-glucosidase [Bailinhaonella thermotolerans]